MLRDRGIVVDRFPHELILELEEINRAFVKAQNHLKRMSCAGVRHSL